MPDVKFAKLVVFINAAVPCSLLLWDAYHHRLGANPQEFALHTTGTLTLPSVALTVPCAKTALDHTGKPICVRSFVPKLKNSATCTARSLCRAWAIFTSSRVIGPPS